MLVITQPMPWETCLAAVWLSAGGHTNSHKDGVPDVRVIIRALRPNRASLTHNSKANTNTLSVTLCSYPLQE